MRKLRILNICVLTLIISILGHAQKSEKQLVDYFLPMKPQSALVSMGIWGAPNVLPRDTANGLEDATLKNWCYWDGEIVKSDDGRYHLYASRWTQSVAHSEGWHIESKGIHAVSDNPMGPYVDKGLLWPDWKNGIGGNVVGLRMHDGRYATITSEITPGEVFVSDSPDGPFKLLGKIKIDNNGFPSELARYAPDNAGAAKYGSVGFMSNVKILLRADGNYLIVARSTAPMLSTTGILGPYKIMGDRVFLKQFPDVDVNHMEDASVWFSGGLYHIIVNHWPTKTTYHFTSEDGINDWKYRGIAFKKDAKIFKYTDGTVNNWEFVERATPFVENEHITHILFSVLDVLKGKDLANDNHGSKIIVVPFDGVAFDRDMQKLVKSEKRK